MRRYFVMRKLVPSSTRSNSTSSMRVRMSLSPQPRRSSAASLASDPLFAPFRLAGTMPRLEMVMTNLSLSTRKR